MLWDGCSPATGDGVLLLTVKVLAHKVPLYSTKIAERLKINSTSCCVNHVYTLTKHIFSLESFQYRFNFLGITAFVKSLSDYSH